MLLDWVHWEASGIWQNCSNSQRCGCCTYPFAFLSRKSPCRNIIETFSDLYLHTPQLFARKLKTKDYVIHIPPFLQAPWLIANPILLETNRDVVACGIPLIWSALFQGKYHAFHKSFYILGFLRTWWWLSWAFHQNRQEFWMITLVRLLQRQFCSAIEMFLIFLYAECEMNFL